MFEPSVIADPRVIHILYSFRKNIMKITEKLRKRHEESTKPTVSFEYFVPKTFQGIQNLYDRMDRMYDKALPQFIDITWNAGGSRLARATSSNDLVFTAQSVLGLETCMHLTCTNMTLEEIDKALLGAKNAGCQNILALRGDPPMDTPNDKWKAAGCGFHYAKDLVKYIRSKYGDTFEIGVAAYPEGHPELKDEELNMKYLKEKVDAGATFMITQMFYDVDNFIDWCRKVREYGIDIPIMPGIMPITEYSSFLRRAKWGSINIPRYFINKLEPIQGNAELVREVGCQLIVGMCQKLLDSGYVNHLHIYTMNLERASLMLLKKLDLLPTEEEYVHNHHPVLPWRKSLNPQRKNEEVRPIFWTYRPYSYVARTSDWGQDEFPNGRFGDSSSPAFGALDLCVSRAIRQSRKRALELWSTPNSIQDIAQLVINYLRGELICLPWSDTPLHHEVDIILPALIELNKNHIITINSQPALNGVRSDDRIYGWGPTNGYVYQKQYLEFLLPRTKLKKFQELLEPNKLLAYLAVDVNDNLATNIPHYARANAVTWGVFPGRRILQPTIVEKVSFLAWKEEFYYILREWQKYLKANGAIESVELLDDLINNYVLVNVVNNDFATGTDGIFDLLLSL